MSNWRHEMSTAQSNPDTEGQGQAWIILGGSLTETPCQRPCRNDLLAAPLLRMFRWFCHSLHCPVKCQTQADCSEDSGDPKNKNKTCRSVSWSRREAVCNHQFVSPHYLFASPPVGLLVGDGLKLWWFGKGRPSRPSDNGSGLLGQCPCLPLPLVVDEEEMRRCVTMAGSVVHAYPRLPFSSWVHLFRPQLSK
jgi:hypothetical protein